MVRLHEPMPLTFVIEGRPAFVTSVVQRHKNLRHLFDNQWLHLIVLDIQAGQFVRYEPVGNWITCPVNATRYSTITVSFEPPHAEPPRPMKGCPGVVLSDVSNLEKTAFAVPISPAPCIVLCAPYFRGIAE